MRNQKLSRLFITFIAVTLFTSPNLFGQFVGEAKLFTNHFFYQNMGIFWQINLPDCEINDMEFDDQDNLWMITRSGIHIIQTRGNTNYQLPVHCIDYFSRQGIAVSSLTSEALSLAWCLKKDDAGNMWIGTRKGLFCYDGETIHEITISEDIPFKLIYHIAIDNKKNIWVLGKETVDKFMKTELIKENTGLAIFNGEKWTSMTGRSGAVPSFSLHSLVFTQDGSAWMAGNKDEGIFQLKDKQWTQYTKENSSLPSNHVYTMTINPFTQEIYIATAQGVLVYNGKEWRTEKIFQNISDITKIFIENEHTIWVGTAESGLYLISDLKHLVQFVPSNKPLLNLNVRKIISRNGFIWLLQPQKMFSDITNNPFGGVAAIKLELMSRPENEQILSNYNSRMVFNPLQKLHYFDKSNVIQFDREAVTIRNAQIDMPLFQEIDKDKYFGILAEGNGEHLIVTKKKGLCRLKGEELETIIPNKKKVFNNDIVQLVKAQDGTIWIASEGDGVLRCSGNQVTVLNKKNAKLPKNKMYTVFVDSQERLWAGTDKGLCLLQGDQFVTYSEEAGLPHEEVYALSEDKNQVLYVGTKKGLAKFQDSRFTTILNSHITQLAIDAKNQLWIGTLYDGLFTYDGITLIKYLSEGIRYRHISQILISPDRKHLLISAHDKSVHLPTFPSYNSLEKAREVLKSLDQKSQDPKIMRKVEKIKSEIAFYTERTAHENKLVSQLDGLIPSSITLSIDL